MKNSIYQIMLNEKIEIDHHESDLYVPVTKKTESIINRYEFFSNITKFKHGITGKLWFDIPFAYLPWWKMRLIK